MSAPEDRDAGRALARRLGSLRGAGMAGQSVSQADLAGALGVSVPLVSSWENGKAIPPVLRIQAYARFFCSERSVRAGRYRLLARGDLTPAEEARRQSLEAELMAYRERAVGGPAGSPPVVSRDPIGEGPWRFPDGRPVTIVCSPLPEELRKRMPYSEPDDPDFIKLYTYADLDALLELHGHIRASNPDILVHVRSATELVTDDYTSHLVLLGGVDWNRITRDLLDVVELPVRQHSFLDDPEGASFEVDTDDGPRRLRPRLADEGGKQVLVEDVAHFYRAPNPYNRRRTVTICNGMFGRGTYGVVRALTDANFRDRNWDFLRTRFPNGRTYSVVTRVRILAGEVLTPDWTVEDSVLHLWPDSDA